MKLSVGYQLRDDFALKILENKDSIGEVYFAYPDFANGRNSTALSEGISQYEFMERTEADLAVLSSGGMSLNLLLNGMCYGKHAQSRSFFNKTGDLIDRLCEKYGLGAVTTTSPLIAKFVKDNFPHIHVRASVNMEIGSTQGMEYLAEHFDSFYAKRELNRNLKELKKLRQWCDNNGKELYGLANSGCLNFCSAHAFHDNLVAHESEISEMDNAYQFEGQCRTFLNKEEARARWLEITNFIRPEDIHLYEDIFHGLKLATRVNKNPMAVVKAYISGGFAGNLPQLLEPDHSDLFFPFVAENKKLPEDFALKIANCSKDCENCGYCKKALADCLVCLE